MAGIPSIAPYPLPTCHDLPDNLMEWRVTPERAVLLIHDMQGYFVAPFEDPLRTELLYNIGLLRDRARRAGIAIAYTAQPGRMTDRQRGLLKDIWGAGMRTAPADQQIVPELAPGDADWLVTKWRYSAFFQSGLLERMRATGRDQLVLCGVYAHIGVLTTALDAFSHDIQPFLIADAIGDFSAADHRHTVSYAAGCCAMVLHTKEFLS